MMNLIGRGYKWITHKLRVFLFYILIAISNLEVQIFKSTGGKNSFGGGVITRMMYRSSILEKLAQGRHDEQYVKQFYEILRKADEFMRKSSSHKIAVSADSHVRMLDDKDKYGRRYGHYGFFDEKHKHHGKTLQEVFEIELEERRTKDDDYKLIKVIDNKPIDAGLSKITDVVKEYKNKEGKIIYLVDDMSKKSKQFKFPIVVAREDDGCINKIEELTEYLHIKEKFLNNRRFEFFIPIKFKTTTFKNDSKVIKDILNINEFFVKNDYGGLTGYSIKNFVKRFEHNNMYEVFRFDGFEMEKIK